MVFGTAHSLELCYLYLHISLKLVHRTALDNKMFYLHDIYLKAINCLKNLLLSQLFE